jgi:hypothetical protein
VDTPEEDDLRGLAESRLADHLVVVHDLQDFAIFTDPSARVLHV